MGQEGALALAAAPGWTQLRSLSLSAAGLGTMGLQALLASGTLRHLNWLEIAGEGWFGSAPLDVSGELARSIVSLPHLAHLQLSVDRLEAPSREILSNSDGLAWHSLSLSDQDEQSFRALRSPDQTPPLDSAQEGDYRGR